MELHVSGSVLQAADLAYADIADVEVGVRPVEYVTVEGIEHLRAEVRLDSFGDGNCLGDTEILSEIARTANVGRVARHGAEAPRVPFSRRPGAVGIAILEQVRIVKRGTVEVAGRACRGVAGGVEVQRVLVCGVFHRL